MFGANEIVGKKYFDKAAEDQLFVTSMFMTLQGEGPYRGEPAFFIRLAKCNLNCSFCDTFFDDGDWLTFDEIEKRIETTIDEFYASKNIERPAWTNHKLMQVDNDLLTDLKSLQGIDAEAELQSVLKKNDIRKNMVLVLTGGEPMLQNNIGTFLTRMSRIFAKTQIESNGTQNTNIPTSTTLVISPKCLEKGGVAIKYLAVRPEVLQRASCLKFVMEANPSSPYSDIPDWAHEWARETGKPIFISPMNVYNAVPQKAKDLRAKTNQISIEERSTVDEVISFWEPGLLNLDENQKNHEYAAQFCIKHGFIFNMQIHLFASLA